MAQPKVFVSHSHEDDVLAERLVADLRAAGADAWLDKTDLGAGNFQQRISQALEACDWFVLVLTKSALASPWVGQEVDAANRLKHQGRIRDLIFVKAGPVAQTELPAMWGIYHIFDATAEYPLALTHILAAMGVTAPTPPESAVSAKAPVSRENKRDRSPDDDVRRASPELRSPSRPRRGALLGALAVLVIAVIVASGLFASQRLLAVFATPTATPQTSCGPTVDMGNPQSEASHNLIGWGEGAYDSNAASPSGDISFRYQPQGAAALVTLCVAKAGVAYTLTTEVQDFGCDDSFEIFVNDNPAPVYQFTGTRANIVRVHTVAIPADDIPSQTVVLGFESTSKDCGIAAVYNIRLSPTFG